MNETRVTAQFFLQSYPNYTILYLVLKSINYEMAPIFRTLESLTAEGDLHGASLAPSVTAFERCATFH